MVELDADLAASGGAQNAVCEIQTSGRASGSAGPEIDLEDVDVQIYREAGYLKDAGAFETKCEWAAAGGTEPELYVKFAPGLGALAADAGATVARAGALALFAGGLFVGLWAAILGLLGQVLVLRAGFEGDRGAW